MIIKELNLFSSIIKCSKRAPNKLSIKDIFNYSKKVKETQDFFPVSNFMKNELETRLAKRIIELEKLPSKMQEIQNISRIKNLYTESFYNIYNFNMKQSNSLQSIPQFHNLLLKISSSHKNIPEIMSYSLYEYKKNNKKDFQQNQKKIDEILNFFYLSRIGIRTLIHSYDNMVSNENLEDYFTTETDLVCKESSETVQHLMRMKYGISPEIKINISNNPTFFYPNNHVKYIIQELLKNACFYTYKKYGEDSDEHPVLLNAWETKKDIVFRVKDYGTSFSKDNLKNIFSYLYTTENLEESFENMNSNEKIVINGLGHGVPLTNVYVSYYGGHLAIVPIEGYSTSCYVYLNKFGHAGENLILDN